MDHLQTRLEALEQRTHTVERQLRWWRGLAGGLLVLAVLTWALPSGMAKDNPPQGGGLPAIEERVAALEDLLKHFSREDNEVFITGANLHLRNGLGSTDCLDEQFQEIPDCPNGLGNLIVGYNESRVDDSACPFTIISCVDDVRTGSHNVVVGLGHNFSSVGGLVVGLFNEISGVFAAVSGGWANTASGAASSVSGGGEGNTASSNFATVSGGRSNRASGDFAAVNGGEANRASGGVAAVNGGFANTASGDAAAVSGGRMNTASGVNAVVSGGFLNTASGLGAAVSGGRNRTAEGEFDWVAGHLSSGE